MYYDDYLASEFQLTMGRMIGDYIVLPELAQAIGGYCGANGLFDHSTLKQVPDRGGL